jgi:hypothetical protein
MKRFVILLTILFTFFNCKVKEKPVFVNVDNVKILTSTSTSIVLTADAVFLNPNTIGGQLKTDAIKIYINDNEVGYVSADAFEVPAKKEFTLPLQATVPLDSIFSRKTIGGLIGSLFSQNLKVNYKGAISYKALGLSYTYNLDETETIKIKL